MVKIVIFVVVAIAMCAGLFALAQFAHDHGWVVVALIVGTLATLLYAMFQSAAMDSIEPPVYTPYTGPWFEPPWV